MKTKTLFLALLLAGLLALCLGSAAQAMQINAIRGAAGPDKTRMVIELDSLGDFRAMLVDSPPRLIVELPADRLDDRAALGLSRLGIRQMRPTQAGGLMKLEFFLKSPVRVIQAFMLPRDGDKPDRLVIDYKAANASEFKAASAQVLGTLPGGSSGTATENGKAGATGILGTLARATGEGEGAAARRSSRKGDGSLAVVSPPPVPSAVRLRRYTVVVDAGHGGKDPGAVTRGVFEKNITLSAARDLVRKLEDSGRYKVVMTRSDDRFILLPERVRIARRVGADLFISLHADMAAENAQASGMSIYTLSDKASDAQTEKLAAAENKVDLLAGIDLSHEQEDVASILIDLAMRENMNQSRFFASRVVGVMQARGMDLLDRPHRYAGFAVLKAADIPSVLVEMGFLSNGAELRRLQDADYRNKLMAGLKSGVDVYFDHVEKNAVE